ncbi:MAG: PAS domain S-box protein [Chromatiales bacterium]|nr:PAS domain S-box protein [Chromatiales bacterium]
MDDAPSPGVQYAILASQTRLLYEQARTGFIATLINTVILATVLWPVQPPAEILAWVAGMTVITLTRWVLVGSWRRDRDRLPLRRWTRDYVIGAALSGAAWGTGAALLFPSASVPHQMVLLIVIAGMSAGGITFLSSVRAAYLAYALPMLPPLALLLFLQESQIHAFLGLLTLVYLGALLVTSARLNTTLTEALRLRHDKDRLLEELARSRDELRDTNRLLSEKLTALTRKEGELRDSNRLLSTIMDNASDAIFSLDREGCFTHVNRAMEHITGHTADTLLGQRFDRLFAPAQQAERLDDLWRILREGEQVTHRLLEIRRPDGQPRTLQFAVTPLREGEPLTALVGTAEDVTERLRAERLKDEFVSSVSHELRTPLTAIRGALGLIDQAGGGGQQAELLDIAQRNCNRLVFLINDLLDLQKLESGKLAFTPRDIPLDDFLHEVLATHQPLAESAGVGLALHDHAPGLTLFADPDRLQQAMANLLSNAIKFSPPDSTVEVGASRHGSIVRIHVRDHGPGIDPAFRPRVFQRFAQGDASSTRQRGGTGLGLNLTKSVIEQMGGRIDFESTPGKGTTFHIDLPVVGP